MGEFTSSVPSINSETKSDFANCRTSEPKLSETAFPARARASGSRGAINSKSSTASVNSVSNGSQRSAEPVKELLNRQYGLSRDRLPIVRLVVIRANNFENVRKVVDLAPSYLIWVVTYRSRVHFHPPLHPSRRRRLLEAFFFVRDSSNLHARPRPRCRR